jgi:HEPN domain-containing protein
MNETVREWLAKSEGDLLTAQREFAVDESPNYDAVCFHAQQCVEKLMKAVLIHRASLPPRTHDLVYLGGFIDPELARTAGLRFLSQSAVAFRYPGESARQEDAQLALEVCTNVREKLLALLSSSEI